ncbi:sensor histidine kinase [Mesonia maritima]|uniref:histidine kinase n=1 Tax=Mesonia maritima TaxID=1793873 RepID=A0ABU1K7C0_9FLAO|nr:HAMP domain-containing sensor histidine kinase [Mesonia maritima]MDR6301500.1 signal transduction histidine kinase [Mesonia maritima]
MKISFKNRIALYYLLATASIVAIAFFILFFGVKKVVYENLDEDLTFEANKHLAEIAINKRPLKFAYKEEWEEREHQEVEVNPVFVQIINLEGKVTDKSPNLKNDFLPYFQDKSSFQHFNTQLDQKRIRQVQIPVMNNEKKVGYIITAMSFESSFMVLQKLKNTLLLSFPLILIALFFVCRYIAGKSIQPITHITKTTQNINKHNLSERVKLPENKDELFELSTSINELLKRIEKTLEREKQFTSDASHELRTPLSSLRGTLEVLVRKPRKQEEYEQKIKYALTEIDRMTAIINQLLFLARFNYQQKEEQTDITYILQQLLSRYQTEINKKELSIKFTPPVKITKLVPSHYTDLILENILSNAIKYSNPQGKILINLTEKNQQLICTITDEGIGIAKEDVTKIFDPFFRSEALNHKHISGSGLGLSIAKKAAEIIDAKINLESNHPSGSTFTIEF